MTAKFTFKNKKQLSDPFPSVLLSLLGMSCKTNLLLIISVIVVQLHNTGVAGKIALLFFEIHLNITRPKSQADECNLVF